MATHRNLRADRGQVGGLHVYGYFRREFLDIPKILR